MSIIEPTGYQNKKPSKVKGTVHEQTNDPQSRNYKRSLKWRLAGGELIQTNSNEILEPQKVVF